MSKRPNPPIQSGLYILALAIERLPDTNFSITDEKLSIAVLLIGKKHPK
jgi:hypothetical protein